MAEFFNTYEKLLAIKRRAVNFINRPQQCRVNRLWIWICLKDLVLDLVLVHLNLVL